MDISGGQINVLDEQANLTRLYESPSRIGALALTNAGNLIFTQNAGVAILNRTSLRVSHNSKLAITLSSFRFNDGACDPQGCFITGLMDEARSKNTGKLYRYDAGLNASVMLDHICTLGLDIVRQHGTANGGCCWTAGVEPPDTYSLPARRALAVGSCLL